jgi:sulfide:quinone oxidoreductase
VLTENIRRFLAGEPVAPEFDGHANCFIETGHDKALLLDFNYDQEPLPGTYPFAGVGPLRLLEESRLNHLGKLGFRWVYWNVLLPGHAIPLVGSQMTMRGKRHPQTTATIDA